jgi:lon-related putative ATP-dependent protease
MDRFVEAAGRRIRQAFDDETYSAREREVVSDIAGRRKAEMDELQRFGMEGSFAIQLTPGGIVSVPLLQGRPIPNEALETLTQAERGDLERRGEEVQARAGTCLHRLHQLDAEAAERIRKLNAEVALFAIAPLIDQLRAGYAAQPAVLGYLDAVRDDVPENLAAFRPDSSDVRSAGMFAQLDDGLLASLDRYRVNVLVDDGQGAPAVSEPNPTYYNLVGRVEYRASFGMMRTDFRQIRPGALHRANGGFLMLEALDVLRSPFAWDALKRALQSRQVRVENLAEQLTLVPTASLEPEPISLDVKVVLIGTPDLYTLLYQMDPQFRELFKVKVDFAPDMRWDQEGVDGYAAFISRCVRDEGLRHLDRSAVARVLEHGARLRENQGKLSARLLEISDVVTEASFLAGEDGHDVVRDRDVDAAIAHREYRSNLSEERVRELITEGTIKIDTAGGRIGQVNGLSVVDVGDHRFGLPSRITASVSVGRGSLISVEREIELSGPIHSKGFLILGGYLAQRYGQEHPLSVRAALTFEQSYSEVDGDSASSAELYALLSALSGLKVDQGLAVTGSVDQRGEIQAVGGVTDKIEGFFQVCLARGLNGRQGVVIPAANVPHLMLRDEVVDAVEHGRFHVWPVRTVDEGIALLAGRPAGARLEDGSFPEGSVHRLVEERLRGYAEALKAFEAPPGEATPDGERRRSSGSPSVQRTSRPRGCT